MSQKKYTCIVKTGDPELGSDGFVKYRLTNLMKFVEFLDKKYPKWCYFNVFDKQTKEQLTSFTKNNKPTRPRL